MLHIIAAMESIHSHFVAKGWDEELFAPVEMEYVDDALYVLVRPFDGGKDVWVVVCFGPFGPKQVSVHEADEDDLYDLHQWRTCDAQRSTQVCPVCLSNLGNHSCY